MKKVFILLFVLSGMLNLSGTSYELPERFNVYSKYGEYVLAVDYTNHVHKVFASKNLKKELWSISLKTGSSSFVVSNDGKSVAIIKLCHVQNENMPKETKLIDSICVRFWNNSGEWKTYTFNEICPNPPKNKNRCKGPLGNFWYYDISEANDYFTIHFTDGGYCSFSMKTGEIISHYSGITITCFWFLVFVTIALTAIKIVKKMRRNDQLFRHDHKRYLDILETRKMIAALLMLLPLYIMFFLFIYHGEKGMFKMHEKDKSSILTSWDYPFHRTFGRWFNLSNGKPSAFSFSASISIFFFFCYLYLKTDREIKKLKAQGKSDPQTSGADETINLS